MFLNFYANPNSMFGAQATIQLLLLSGDAACSRNHNLTTQMYNVAANLHP